MTPARFITDLETRQVPGQPGKNILTAVLSFWSNVVGAQIDVPAGFISDFASVPRVPIVFEMFGGDIGDDPAAALHDYLYSTRKYPRETCDAIFKEALRACGVSAWRAYAMWLGVRAGGDSHYATA
jgi:hypothetical protein